MFQVCMMLFHLRASAEAEPGTYAGCSCCSQWVGSHPPCVRRVPASLSARGLRAASARRRGLPHTGAAPLPMDEQHREKTAAGLAMVSRYDVSATSRARAHLNTRSARAMATTTCLAFFPLALSWQ
jgi:hypothetical protein